MICSESGPWIGSKNVVDSTWASLSEASFMTRMCDSYSVKESLHKKFCAFYSGSFCHLASEIFGERGT